MSSNTYLKLVADLRKDYLNVCKVIESCKKQDQLESAAQYGNNFRLLYSVKFYNLPLLNRIGKTNEYSEILTEMTNDMQCRIDKNKEKNIHKVGF